MFDIKGKLEKHVQVLIDNDGMTRKEALEYIVDNNAGYFTSEYTHLANLELTNNQTWDKIENNLKEYDNE